MEQERSTGSEQEAAPPRAPRARPTIEPSKDRRDGGKGKKRWLYGLALAPVVAGVGAWLGLDALDRKGREFYAAGRRVVGHLGALAAAARARDSMAITRFFSPAFRGGPLGFNGLAPAAAKDGVELHRFTAGVGASPSSSEAPAPGGRAAVAAEWQQYLAGFERIEEVGIHLDRVEEWEPGGAMTATVRFELIGTPHGAPHPGIDRAIWRMRFGRVESQRGRKRTAGPGSLDSPGEDGERPLDPFRGEEEVPAGAAARLAPETPETAELEILEASLVEGERVISERPQFVDVARQAGVDFVNRHYPAFLDPALPFGMIRYGPGGITAVDYDNDGFHDLFIPDGVASKLLRNRGDGTFEDVTESAGLGGLDGVSVAVFADYDNDGWKDLFVSRTFGPNQLFHNNGDGTFTDVTAGSGLGEDCCTTVASWGDYDNDGCLDLYLGRYLDPRRAIPTTFYARNGEPNRLYHNNGDGTFTDVTAQAGVGDTGLCLGTAWGDYDGDGRADLFVVNDFGRCTLYHNNGDGTFEDVTVAAGALAYGAGMNASFADYDNDGRLDLYTTDIRSEHGWFAAPPTVGRYMANSFKQGVWRTDMPLYFQIFRQSGLDFVDIFRQMAAGNHLLHNRGDGTFEDLGVAARANPVGWFWGAVFADFDNDGWLDLYCADGWVYNEPGTEIELEFLNGVVGRQKDYKRGVFFDPRNFGGRSWHGWERNRHLRNEGDGTFREIGRGAGTDLVANSRGVAVADFWNRGALDLAVAASGGRHALLRNEIGSRRHWLQVELVGTRSNRDAVGARVSVASGGSAPLRQLREVAAGDGYASQSALRLHFGLGDAAVVDELTVRWPASGTVETFRDVAADRIVELTEGSGSLVEKRYDQARAVTRAPDQARVGTRAPD
ncbi:MAG TPA: CRTAC1 family protein [Thermoanaerobaculia bacterium]|nr:CRTAC1 family protein [Thermoanaerobaculia bacterium]